MGNQAHPAPMAHGHLALKGSHLPQKSTSQVKKLVVMRHSGIWDGRVASTSNPRGYLTSRLISSVLAAVWYEITVLLRRQVIKQRLKRVYREHRGPVPRANDSI